MFDSLNGEQQRAVTAGDGPVLIVAGPGTGKTKTLTARIAYLILNHKAKAGQILALTFTKKAAEEIKSRVASVASGAKPPVSTFHALCFELLDQKVPFVTDAARLQIIKSLSRPKDLKELSTRELGLQISLAKNLPNIEDPIMAKVVRAYNKVLAEQKVRDFDDLLLDTYKLLKDDADKRKMVQDRYKYILIDEFQDTNHLQYELLKLLCGHKNLFVIGDPNQSIYGFRGASGTIFEEFRADFPPQLDIVLTTNYRSAPQIVRLANALFSEAPALQADSETIGLVRAVQVLNEYSEAEWVLNEIQRGIGGGDLLKAVSDDIRDHHRRLSDFAVLYRSRSAALTFQKLVAESGLPYQIVGDGSPYEQPQIQAIIALLRSSVSHEQVALEGFGSAQRHLLEQELATTSQTIPSVLVEKLVAILGFEPSRSLQQLSGVLVRFRDIASAVDYFDDIAEHGFYDATADVITLLTIHAAKGLEFPHVFLLGTEEGILPSGRGDEAEERRLLYVAVTRAQQRLEIMYAKNRVGQKAEMSRFIAKLPPEVLKHLVDPGMETQVRRIAKRAAKNSQTKLF